MWNTPTKSGNFKFTERYYNHEGEQKFVSTTLPTNSPQATKKAQKILDKRIQDILDEIADDTEGLTFKEISKLWLELKSHSVKASTITAYASHINIMNQHMGDVDVQSLVSGQINRLFLGWQNEGLSYKTVIERHKILKSIIKYAVNYDYLEEDKITHKLRIEKINLPEDTEMKYLEPFEVEELFKRMIDGGHEELVDFFNLQMQTGMRFGEVAALHVQDIDLINNNIYVQYTYDRANKLFTLPKNNKTRLIHINDQTVSLIKKIQRRRKLMLLAYGVRDNNLLFFQKNGSPLDLTTSQDALHQFEPKDKPLTTHVFRHTFITRLVESYVPTKLIAEHVGHSDTSMIEKVYNHFSDKMQDDLKEAIRRVNI